MKKTLHLIVVLLLCNLSASAFHYSYDAVTKKGFFKIPARTELIVGEFVPMAFKLTVANASCIKLQLLQVNKSSRKLEKGWALLPGGKTQVVIKSRQKMVLQNLSNEDMHVEIKISSSKAKPIFGRLNQYVYK